MATIGEEIDAFKNEYVKADKEKRTRMANIVAAEYYKINRIWEFIEEHREER